MMNRCLSVSERRARLLLSAWNSGDLSRLESALASISTASNTSLSYGEIERIEMVNEVSSTIQGWIDRCRDQNELETSLRLLRHLASAVAPAASIHASAHRQFVQEHVPCTGDERLAPLAF
jgi:hypothetical protein